MNMGVERTTGVQNKDEGNRKCSKYQEKTKDRDSNGAQGTQGKAQEVKFLWNLERKALFPQGHAQGRQFQIKRITYAKVKHRSN